MSQADSAYTTSRSIFPGGPADRRRQFVSGGAAILAGVITPSRDESVRVSTAPEPLTGLQGEGGAGRHQGRSDDRPAGRAFRRSSQSDHSVEIAA